MGDPNSYTNNYLDQCLACPPGLLKDEPNCVINNARRKRIWNQSRMSSSMGLLKRKTMLVSKQIGQAAPLNGSTTHTKGTIASFIQVGGPGDMQSAIQKSNYQPAVGRRPCYNMGRLRNRTAYNNKKGVDRKHGSYDRYLARRVGGVLRKETTIHGSVSEKYTSYVGQPRNRTGTKVSTACNNKGMTTGKSNFSCTGSKVACCENRIPSYTKLKAAGGGDPGFAAGTYCNETAYKLLTSGNCGNPGVCVAGRCSCR
jgi:hypothetical protein